LDGSRGTKINFIDMVFRKGSTYLVVEAEESIKQRK
jgi:hypothetical protein